MSDLDFYSGIWGEFISFPKETVRLTRGMAVNARMRRRNGATMVVIFSWSLNEKEQSEPERGKVVHEERRRPYLSYLDARVQCSRCLFPHAIYAAPYRGQMQFCHCRLSIKTRSGISHCMLQSKTINYSFIPIIFWAPDWRTVSIMLMVLLLMMMKHQCS